MNPIDNQRPVLTCDTMALEYLNRLEYISLVPERGVKTDRP
ncbi:hypothetical protein ABID25_005445 [Mesorhizobium abyssinicae]